MTGAIILTVVILVVLPTLFMVGGALAAFLLGWRLRQHAVDTHPDSELLELNR